MEDTALMLGISMNDLLKAHITAGYKEHSRYNHPAVGLCIQLIEPDTHAKVLFSSNGETKLKAGDICRNTSTGEIVLLSPLSATIFGNDKHLEKLGPK